MWQLLVGIGIYVNVNKRMFLRFKQERPMSTLSSKPLNLEDPFTCHGRNISSTESNVSMWVGRVWDAVDKLLIIWKSDLSDKIKRVFFQAVVMSVLPYRCTTWTPREKAWWELQKNFTGSFEQILDATTHKTAAVRSRTSLSHKPPKSDE